MKCNEIDMIEYVEGRASKEARLHVENCKRCGAESVKLMNLSHLLSNQYVEGKKLGAELDRKLGSIDIQKMKDLPEGILEKVREMKEKGLVSRLRKVAGKGKKGAEELVEGLLSPRMHALPASPKDITKTKKRKKKKIAK